MEKVRWCNRLQSAWISLRTFFTPTASMLTLGDLVQARYAGNDPRRPTYQEAQSRRVPTPTASDGTGGCDRNPSRQGAPPLREVAGGPLNPTWVEWLMGCPIGWTALKPLEMDGCRWWERWLSSFSVVNSNNLQKEEAER